MTPGHHPDSYRDTPNGGAALPPGNSERIRAKFGSYGIKVLENSPAQWDVELELVLDSGTS
jgi:hypothetical protein